jgi:hypothetical protein
MRITLGLVRLKGKYHDDEMGTDTVRMDLVDIFVRNGMREPSLVKVLTTRLGIHGPTLSDKINFPPR